MEAVRQWFKKTDNPSLDLASFTALYEEVRPGIEATLDREQGN